MKRAPDSPRPVNVVYFADHCHKAVWDVVQLKWRQCGGYPNYGGYCYKHGRKVNVKKEAK